MTENNNKKDKKSFKKIEITNNDGLKISYDKKELETFTPHILAEISKENKTLRIDSIKHENKSSNDHPKKVYSSHLPSELINPGVIDFIRRCSTQEEAVEILDYLFKKAEIRQEEYQKLKKQICQEGGLKKIIEESGGFKKPGYYLRKYYKKDFNSQKFKSNAK